MSIESEIMDRLEAFAGVIALVGSGASARIYPINAPQGATAPFIVYRMISARSEIHMGGISGLGHRIYQFDCVDENKLGVIDLAEQVRLALHGWRDNTTNIRGAEQIGVADLPTIPASGKDRTKFQRALDVRFSFFESAS